MESSLDRVDFDMKKVMRDDGDRQFLAVVDELGYLFDDEQIKKGVLSELWKRHKKLSCILDALPNDLSGYAKEGFVRMPTEDSSDSENGQSGDDYVYYSPHDNNKYICTISSLDLDRVPLFSDCMQTVPPLNLWESSGLSCGLPRRLGLGWPRPPLGLTSALCLKNKSLLFMVFLKISGRTWIVSGVMFRKALASLPRTLRVVASECIALLLVITTTIGIRL